MKKAKWRIEMLSEEELRRLIESLSIREIIEPALDKWIGINRKNNHQP